MATEGPQPQPRGTARASTAAAPKASKFDVPTAGEQRALRSADGLLRSNLLVLQAQVRVWLNWNPNLGARNNNDPPEFLK